MSGAVVLVGLSGSGKSTVGRVLAEIVGLRFADSDRVIEERMGAPIGAIFASSGEQRFREIEAAVIAELCRRACVVATGGGAVLRAGNRRAMRAGNLVVWLDLPLRLLAQRLASHRRGEVRPLLGDNVMARLDGQWQARRALYAAAAHIRISKPPVGRFGSQQAARLLLRSYRCWEDQEGKGVRQ